MISGEESPTLQVGREFPQNGIAMLASDLELRNIPDTQTSLLVLCLWPKNVHPLPGLGLMAASRERHAVQQSNLLVAHSFKPLGTHLCGKVLRPELTATLSVYRVPDSLGRRGLAAYSDPWEAAIL